MRLQVSLHIWHDRHGIVDHWRQDCWINLPGKRLCIYKNKIKLDLYVTPINSSGPGKLKIYVKSESLRKIVRCKLFSPPPIIKIRQKCQWKTLKFAQNLKVLYINIAENKIERKNQNWDNIFAIYSWQNWRFLHNARRPKEKWTNNSNKPFTEKGILFSNKHDSLLIR